MYLIDKIMSKIEIYHLIWEIINIANRVANHAREVEISDKEANHNSIKSTASVKEE